MKTMCRFGLLSAALLLSTGCASKMEIVAHRGASYLAPENTVASARLAWEERADAVEVDVYFTTDQRVVVIHDSTTKRTAGEELEVAASTAEQLRRLDVGSLKDASFTGERIPLLEEIIETVPAGKKLFVEIKCGPEVLPALEKIIVESGKRSQIVIIGFGIETVMASKQLMPDIPTYWLVSTKKEEQTKAWIPHDKTLADQAVAAGLDGLDVHYAGVTKEFARSVRKAGLGLYVWTVNDSAEAARLARIGVDGITTDRPGWLRTELSGSKRLF